MFPVIPFSKSKKLHTHGAVIHDFRLCAETVPVFVVRVLTALPIGGHGRTGQAQPGPREARTAQRPPVPGLAARRQMGTLLWARTPSEILRSFSSP